MTVVGRYLFGRMVVPLGVALVLVCGLLLLLQLLRLGHHLVGAGAGVGLLGTLVLWSLPTLLLYALPLALVMALVYAYGRLGEARELLALRAAGASSWRLARPAIALSIAVAAACYGAARLEPLAIERLRDAVGKNAARALVLGAPAGRFNRLLDDTTLYFESRAPATDAAGSRSVRLHGVLLARGGTAQLVLARQARVSFDGAARLHLALHGAELQMRNRTGGLRRVRFERLEQTIDLAPMVRRTFGFLVQTVARPGRQLGASIAALALGLLAAAIGLRAERRLRAAALAAVAVTGYFVLSWGAELLLPGVLARVGVGAAAALLGLGLLSDTHPRASGKQTGLESTC